MNVQIMQCPSCGSPLPAPAIGTITSCTYCGASLEVTKGASGSPMARLSEIKEDTSFIAKERARDHLRGQIEKLGAEISGLESRVRSVETQDIGCTTFPISLPAGSLGLWAGITIAARVDSSLSWAWGLLGAIVTGGLLFLIVSRVVKKQRDRELREVAEAVAEPLAQRRQELAEVTEAMQRLEQELNVLAKRV